jgi:hypothetical protein
MCRALHVKAPLLFARYGDLSRSLTAGALALFRNRLASIRIARRTDQRRLWTMEFGLLPLSGASALQGGRLFLQEPSNKFAAPPTCRATPGNVAGRIQ